MKQDKHLQVLERAGMAADLHRKGFKPTEIAATMMVTRQKAYYYLDIASTLNIESYMQALKMIKGDK